MNIKNNKPVDHQTVRNHKSLVKNYLGFTLTSTLVASAIAGMLFVAVIHMLNLQYKEFDYVRQQIIGMSIKHLILQTLKNSGACNCHFTQNSGNDGNGQPLGPFTVKTPNGNTYTTPDINLGSFRTSCDFVSSNNIIAASGQKVPNSKLLIKTVKIKDIQPTGGASEYKGNLTVGYAIEGYNRVPAPITIPLLFAGEPTGGGADTDTIKNCGRTPSQVTQPVNQGSETTLVFTGRSSCGGRKYGDCVCANADTIIQGRDGVWVACPPGKSISDVKWNNGNDFFRAAPPAAGRGACAMQLTSVNRNPALVLAVVTCIDTISP